MEATTQTGTYRPSASLILAAKQDSLEEYDYSVSQIISRINIKLTCLPLAKVTVDKTN